MQHMTEALLPPSEAAKILGIKPGTLSHYHRRPPVGGAPPVALLTPGGQNRYRRADLLTWKASRPARDYESNRDPVTNTWQKSSELTWQQRVEMELTPDGPNPYDDLDSQEAISLLHVARMDREFQMFRAVFPHSAIGG